MTDMSTLYTSAAFIRKCKLVMKTSYSYNFILRNEFAYHDYEQLSSKEVKDLFHGRYVAGSNPGKVK